MNWRLITSINAAIALITLTLVVVDLRAHLDKRSAQSLITESENARSAETIASRHRHRELDDITQMRVDQIGSVSPSELYQILEHATPEQITILARKFDDLSYNAPTHAAAGIFFQAWAELDSRNALKSAVHLKQPRFKFAATDTIVHSVSPWDCPDLVKYFKENADQEMSPGWRDSFLSALIGRWAEIDAPAAAKVLDNFPVEARRLMGSAAKQIAFNWATLDPSSAVAWATQQQQLRVEGADTFLTSAVEGWCEGDIDAGSEYIASHSDQPNVSNGLAVAMMLLFDQSPDKAASWVGSISSPEAKAEATRQLAVRWADKDPLAAARWFSDLADTDQSMSVGGLAATWAELDFKGVSKWIGGLQGDIRDMAIQAAIGNARNASPAESLGLASSMESGEQRTGVIESIVVRWANSEPQAARAWIQSSSLSNEEKEKLFANSAFHPESPRDN